MFTNFTIVKPAVMTKNKVDHKTLMKEYRFKRGISQADMAQTLGMRQQLYSNIETGRTKLSVEFATLFKRKTGVDLIDGGATDAPAGLNQESTVADHGSDLKPIENCDLLRERLLMKDELITALKQQIEILQRMMEQK